MHSTILRFFIILSCLISSSFAMEEGNSQGLTAPGHIPRSNSNETFELVQQELIAPMSDTEDEADDEDDLDRQLSEDFGGNSGKRKVESALSESQASSAKKQASSKRWIVALLKSEVQTYEDALKDGLSGISSSQLKDNLPGTMYIKSNPIKQLSWVPTIQSYIAPQQSVSGMTGEANRVESAVMFMTAESRKFAIIYGKGRTMLDPQKLENEFGLRVAVNAVDPNKILRLSEKTLETNSRSTTTIYAAPTELYKFQPERYGALIKGITAKVSQDEANIDNSKANYTLSGSKAFVSFSKNLDLKDLPSTLKGLLDHYNSQEYKNKFPWFKDIRPLDNDDLVMPTLHTELLKAVKDPSKYLLCEPWHEVMETESEEKYRVKFTEKKSKIFTTLEEAFKAMQTYMKDESLSVKTLRGKKIERLGEDGKVITSFWTWYDSIALVLSIKNGVYALHEGSWFKIDNDYAAGIDNRINKLLLSVLDYPELLKSQNKEEPEAEYLRRVVQKTPNELLLMDQRCVAPTAGHVTPIEVCDLLYRKQDVKALIHVKRDVESSLLSHLFNQGVVSGKTLKSDSPFRAKAQDKFTQSELMEWLKSSNTFEKFSTTILQSKKFKSKNVQDDKITFILEKYTQHIKGKKIQESSFKTKDATKLYDKAADKDKVLFDILKNHLLDGLRDKLGQISSELTNTDNRDQKLREQWLEECLKILGNFLPDDAQKQMLLELEKWQQKFSGCLPKDSFNPKDYQVLFGIITDKGRATLSETLPFFSRITLDNAATELQNMGYSVGVKLIGF